MTSSYSSSLHPFLFFGSCDMGECSAGKNSRQKYYCPDSKFPDIFVHPTRCECFITKYMLKLKYPAVARIRVKYYLGSHTTVAFERAAKCCDIHLHAVRRCPNHSAKCRLTVKKISLWFGSGKPRAQPVTSLSRPSPS